MKNYQLFASPFLLASLLLIACQRNNERKHVAVNRPKSSTVSNSDTVANVQSKPAIDTLVNEVKTNYDTVKSNVTPKKPLGKNKKVAMRKEDIPSVLPNKQVNNYDKKVVPRDSLLTVATDTNRTRKRDMETQNFFPTGKRYLQEWDPPYPI